MAEVLTESRVLKEPMVVTEPTVLREPTLGSLGLGTVIDIFRKGRLPVATADLVDRVFDQLSSR